MIAVFADISLWQLLLVAGVALIGSVVGGVAGYGTGALMPLVLVPILGPEPVVPIIAISGLLTNSGRVVAFLRLVDWRRSAIALVGAIPFVIVSAYGFTLLTGKARADSDRRHADPHRAVALRNAPPRDRARRWRAAVQLDGLRRGDGRHRRRRRDPAVHPDVGGVAGRGGDRDRRGDLDRGRHRAAVGVRVCRRRSPRRSSRSAC